MATKTDTPEEFKPLEERPTWQDKLDAGKPLNPLEEVKADADFNYKRRLREAEEQKRFEQLKANGRQGATTDDSSSNDGKKGNN